jgi:hypothetical protein
LESGGAEHPRGAIDAWQHRREIEHEFLAFLRSHRHRKDQLHRGRDVRRGLHLPNHPLEKLRVLEFFALL